MTEISFIIPCYNEQENIPVFYEKLLKEVSEIDFELIFVDDGSEDNTLAVIKRLAAADERVKYLSFSRNFGKEAAMIAGFEKSTGNYVVSADADLQDPLNLIHDMYKAVKEDGYDCAGTRRVTRKNEAPLRSFFARQFYKIIRASSGMNIVDGARDYRLMSRPMVNAILSLTERNRFSKGIFAWVGFKTKYFEFENINRTAGETKWSFWALLVYALDGLIAFSAMPLYFISILGLFFFFLSILFIIFIIIRTLVYGDVMRGWPSLACIILFMGGIQLLCTGILGQYAAKIYNETKKRPLYIIKESK
ncbi:MAG: glycosyltransferase family 2 protein [Elusimicrobia bacterium]|nr:glycosyltransferase family 2 protein [Elusimicrobiota bacterium]